VTDLDITADSTATFDKQGNILESTDTIHDGPICSRADRCARGTRSA
jgi:hypothetical protein